LAACVKETYYMFCLSMWKPLCGQPTLEYGAFEWTYGGAVTSLIFETHA
jgi:hypothetical protein